MIVNGVKDTNTNPSQEIWNYAMAPEKKNEADGWYILSTYEPYKLFELIARYDRYNRFTNDKLLYRKFETVTTGFSYRFKNYNRIDVNYAINSIDAPNNTVADNLLEAVGNLLRIQLTLVYK